MKARSEPVQRRVISRVSAPTELARARYAFLNVPYDRKFESLFLAFITGLCRFGLIPRATVEIPGSQRRLERILDLISECSYSFHDLSRVTLDRNPPATPRFNMPFELGLAVATSLVTSRSHQWYLFEARPYRINKSLSDLNGTDPYIHGNQPEGVLRELTNALVLEHHSPTLEDLKVLYAMVRKQASKLKRDLNGAPLFEARAFHEVVVLATEICSESRGDE
jgi:hypothetical protein